MVWWLDGLVVGSLVAVATRCIASVLSMMVDGWMVEKNLTSEIP